MTISTQHPPPIEIAGCFLKLGAQGFGGLGAILALLTHDLVERRRWLCEADITEALTYTKLLPGSTVVQVVAYLGWKLRGWAGGAIATAAFLLPAFLVMLGLAVGYRVLSSNVALPLMKGLTAAIVGLLILTIWLLGRKNIASVGGILIALGALIGSAYFGMNPAAIVVASGCLGVLAEAQKEPP